MHTQELGRPATDRTKGTPNSAVTVPITPGLYSEVSNLTADLKYLKTTLDLFWELPKRVGKFSQTLAEELGSMCQKYEGVIKNLKNRVDNLEVQVQSRPEQTNMTLILLRKQIKQKNQKINQLNDKLFRLPCATKPSSKIQLTDRTNRSREDMKQNTDISKPIVNISDSSRLKEIKNPSVLLRQRYLKYKQENDMLKLQTPHVRNKLPNTACLSSLMKSKKDNDISNSILNLDGNKQETVRREKINRQDKPATERKSADTHVQNQEVSEVLSQFLKTLRSC